MPTLPLPLVSARPVLRVDGQDAADLAAALVEMAVEERSDGMARAELVFGAWGQSGGTPGYALFDRRRLEFGRRIELRLGDEPVFAGRVFALEGRFPAEGAGESRLAVLAEDALQDLRMTRRSRSFEDLSDDELLRRIASDHGLQARAETNGPTHRVLAQVNQSDLALLRERALAIGAELWIDGDTLHLAPRPARAGAPIRLDYGASLRAFDVRADLAGQRTRLTVGGWDVAGKRAIAESADASVLDAELDGGDGGLALLQRSFGERADALAHRAPANAAEARAVAEGTLRQLGRRFVTGRGVAEPTPALRTGRVVELGGLGPLFDGRYAVTAFCHRFDARLGLSTEFAVERPAVGRP